MIRAAGARAKHTRGRAALLAALGIAGVLGAGCERRPAPVEEAPDALSLLALPFARLEVPDSSLPPGLAADAVVDRPLAGWRAAGGDDRSHSHVIELEEPLTADARLIGPGGVVVERSREDARPIDPEASSLHGIWQLTATRLALQLPAALPPPRDGDYHLRFPRVGPREASWNHRSSGLSDPDFVRRGVQTGLTSRRGLLLPAPAVAEWELIVPPAGELHMAPGLLEPDRSGASPSDGVRLRVELEDEQGIHALWTRELHPAASGRPSGFAPVHVDLSRWSGAAVRLRIRSEPGYTATRDYAFVAEPVVAARRARPRRAILIFVDTLRPDRLGLYGHDRDTSPALDRLAATSAVFDQARSVAPWTLPAARSLLTGRQPEDWERAQTLAGWLGARGFATAMFGANHFLMSNFGMQRDWLLHDVAPWGSAELQTGRALAWLSAHEGRDALLLVHYMEPHLPYEEPATYRRRFAGDAQIGLPEHFVREQVLEEASRQRDVGTLRAQLLDRYDANVRYLDDQLARLFGALAADDVVVVVSDHGEEFFEHGGFEHGHALWDEVMRVPLLIRARGLRAGRVGSPVSLIDVAPTVLELLGVTPPEGISGRSLVALATGEADVRRGFEERSLAFGRPLYGGEGWGLVHAGRKYVVRGGRERLVDLTRDPGERAPRERVPSPSSLSGAAGTPDTDLSQRLADAVGRQLRYVLRLAASEAGAWPPRDLVLHVELPGGFERVWVGDDPTRRSSVRLSQGQGGSAFVATWAAGYRGPREVFAIPRDPQADVRAAVRDGEGELALAAPDRDRRAREPELLLFGKAPDGRELRVTRALAFVPDPDAAELTADDPTLRAQLRALGYLVGEAGRAAPPADPDPRPEASLEGDHSRESRPE